MYISIQVERDLNMTTLNSTTNFSQFLKFLAFLSLKMHHIKKRRVNLQASKMHLLPKWPLQLANSTTLLSMAHSTQKRWKIETHNSLASSQWRRRCLLHIYRQSTTMTCHFLKLSKVKDLP